MTTFNRNLRTFGELDEPEFELEEIKQRRLALKEFVDGPAFDGLKIIFEEVLEQYKCSPPVKPEHETAYRTYSICRDFAHQVLILAKNFATLAEPEPIVVKPGDLLPEQTGEKIG